MAKSSFHFTSDYLCFPNTFMILCFSGSQSQRTEWLLIPLLCTTENLVCLYFFAFLPLLNFHHIYIYIHYIYISAYSLNFKCRLQTFVFQFVIKSAAVFCVCLQLVLTLICTWGPFAYASLKGASHVVGVCPHLYRASCIFCVPEFDSDFFLHSSEHLTC